MTNPDPYARYFVKDLGENGKDWTTGKELPDTSFAVVDSVLNDRVVCSKLPYMTAIRAADAINGNTALQDAVTKEIA